MARRTHPKRKARAPRAEATPATVAPNYQYWREHGREWPDEYDQRKKSNLAYHVQELLLADYFAHSAPARVLEYGCGPGRHLRYLNDLPGIEVHGYDQSASMAEGVRRWASQEWFAERVVVGAPTGRLPYADRSFDVVFTAEVLVHVRPEDLEERLAEMVRVASWQVLHLETSHDWELHHVAHEGCWRHDLVAAYARLGLRCELLPRAYAMHTPHRVVLDRKRRVYTWPTGPIALLARMETEIGRGLQELAEQGERERKRAESAEARQQGLGDRVSELIRQLDDARQRARQAELRSESHLARLQTATEALEKQGSAVRERAAADAAARQKEEDRAREAEARCETYLGRIQSLNEALEKQITASQGRAAKDAETRRGLEDRNTALERQVAASQERIGRELEVRQRLEERIALAGAEEKRLAGLVAESARERKRLEDRVAALEGERQGVERRLAEGAARVAALQEQVEKERARAREAETRGEAQRARLESTREALQAQVAASQERAAKDAETRRRIEERAAALERQIVPLQERIEKELETRRRLEERGATLQAAQKAAAERAEAAAARGAELHAQLEQERQRARDAEARAELHLSRIQETREKSEAQLAETRERLEVQRARAKQGETQLAEVRQRLEARVAELGEQHARALERAKQAEERIPGLEERVARERERARDAEGRCELYLARVAETKQALEAKLALVRELQQRSAELERDHEAALAEEAKRIAELGARLRDAERRAAELAKQLQASREDVQRVARDRAAQRRDDEAKRRRLAEQVRSLESQHAGFVASLAERLGAPGSTAGGEGERLLLERAGQTRFELGFIQQRFSYRVLRRLRRTLAYRLARWLPRRNRDVVSVRVLGDRNPAAGDCEVWLLAARSEPGAPPVPWDFMAQQGAWHRRPDPNAPQGEVLVSKRGRLRFALHGSAPVLTFLKHPWSGRVEVRWGRRREVFDLYSPHTTGLDVHPAQQPMTLPASATAAEPAPQAPPAAASSVARRVAPRPFSAEDRRWLESVQQKDARVLALHVPRWLGVTASTRVLFEHLLPFPRSAAQEPYHVSDDEIRYNAELILASGARHVVASGGDEIHFRVLREVKRRDPGRRCDLLWHASYVQMTEDYQWALLRTWVEGARAGVVDVVGTVKQGMERFFESAGLRSRFVMNWVPEIPDGPSTPREGGPHLGLWISGNSYRKLPYAMLAAVKMIPGAVLHGSNFVKRVRDAIDLFEIPVARHSDKPLPQEEMLQAIRETHLTLYVTFSECSPMLPLESLSVGTPCLVSPTSHLFEDDDFLRSRLVVPAPDRADVIAEWARGALAERAEIVRAYRRWAPGYNERARRSLEEFLRA
jgi:SAM-dependent methyltransferase